MIIKLGIAFKLFVDRVMRINSFRIVCIERIVILDDVDFFLYKLSSKFLIETDLCQVTSD